MIKGACAPLRTSEHVQSSRTAEFNHQNEAILIQTRQKQALCAYSGDSRSPIPVDTRSLIQGITKNVLGLQGG